MCGCEGGVVVVVEGVCVAVRVVGWRVCLASMVVWLWWRVCSCDGGTVAVERACAAALKQK